MDLCMFRSLVDWLPVCRHNGRSVSWVLVRTAWVSLALGWLGLCRLRTLCQRSSHSCWGT